MEHVGRPAEGPARSDRVRILLVDDHTLVRKGLAYLLCACIDGAEVVEAGDADHAMTLLNGQTYDVALVDIRLPGRDGLELLHDIRATWPSVPVIIVTNYDNNEYVKIAMAEGASGYLLKDATPADLTQAITVAMSGAGNVLSARAVRSLFDRSDADSNSSKHGSGGRGTEAGLTRREEDILELLAAGHSNREISKQLFLSEKTVKAHLASVFRKLGVSNRTQAAMMAISMGIGEVPRHGMIGNGDGTHSRAAI
jgi:DNA-binding NarL/FixJ family response regulator